MNKKNYGSSVRFQVLGPVRLTAHAAELPLGGRQQRLVLALLIAANGRTVSTGALIDDVWGEEPPPSARKALQGYVHHLRGQVGDALSTETNGYSLHTDGDVDAVEFEQLRNDAVDLLELDPSQASDVLGRALALWTGPAYTDLATELALVPEIARLEDLRALALGDRIEANLRLGGHASLIGELAGLTYEYPLQERFRAQQMTALFRSGRHVEALRAYERFRRYLKDEMGLEPSAELQLLESQILEGDEALKSPEPSTATPNAVRGYELREVVASGPFGETCRAYQRSVGREVAVRVLNSGVADDPRFIADFLTDTKAIAALEHPNICFVFDTWREPGHAYQVSRWLGGGSLADALVGGPLTMTATLRMLDEIGGALTHAHREGVVHGRIGPTNVLFDDSGHAYLSDFAVGSARPRSEEQDRIDLAALTHLALSGRKPRDVGGVLESDFDDTEMSQIMGSVFEVAFSGDGYARPEHFVRALRQATGMDVSAPMGDFTPLTDVRNPYKGLQAFQETDADDFFGRDELIDGMLAELDKSRLLAVVGPSGSGKSSTVKAGLLPRLRSRSDGPIQLITEMYPGAYPFEELEDALLRVGVDRSSVLEELVGDERGLTRVLKHILPSDDAELVLVIDQFEELFSMVPAEQTRRLFLDSLVAATSDPKSRLHVVLTMRADFFDRPLGYPEFGALFEAGLVPVKVPSDDELALAISQPARSAGVEFEEGLIGQIVRDVAGQPGSLPLLQYALTELFDDRDSNTITLATYQRGGGVFGALGRRAEALYDELTEPGRLAIRQAFLRMVSVDEGSDDLRRRVRRSQLHGEDVDDAGLTEALQIYGAHRLLTFDLDPVTSGPTVEVAHEALLREWPRLSSWIDDQRDDLVVRKRLDVALAEWKGSGEQAGYLPAGGRLAQFEEWSSDTPLSLTLEERAFLEAGTEREADLLHRAASRRRRLLIGLGVVAAVTTLLAGFAFLQQQEADDAAAEARTNAERADANAASAEESEGAARASEEGARVVAFTAETGRLAGEAAALAETDPQLALLLASEAHAREPSSSTLTALQRVMLRSAPIYGFVGDPWRSYVDVAWDPTGRKLVAVHLAGVEVYDALSLQRVYDLALPVGYEEHAPPFVPFAVSPDGEFAVVATAPTGAIAIHLSTGEQAAIAATSAVRSLAFSHDSALLAVALDEGNLTVLRRSDFSTVTNFDGHPERYRDFEPDLRVRGVDDEMISYLDRSARPVSALAFSPDDSLLVSAEMPVIRTWDLETGSITSEILAVHEGFLLLTGRLQPTAVQELEIVGDERLIARVRHRDALIDLDLESGEELSNLGNLSGRDTDNQLIGAEPLSTGGWAITADTGRTRILDEQGELVETTRSVLAKPGGTDLSPDGGLLATTSTGGVTLLSLDGRVPLASPIDSNETAMLSVSSAGDEVLEVYFVGANIYERSDGGYEGTDFGGGLRAEVLSAANDGVRLSETPGAETVTVLQGRRQPADPANAPFGFTMTLYDREADEFIGPTLNADNVDHAFSP